MKVMDALKQGAKAIEGLMASTSKMFGEHVDRVTEFQANPLIGGAALKASSDTVFAGLDKMDEFRSKSIESMGANITMLKGILAEGRAPDAARRKPISESSSNAPSGPVTL